jgi:hypothetical protein
LDEVAGPDNRGVGLGTRSKRKPVPVGESLVSRPKNLHRVSQRRTYGQATFSVDGQPEQGRCVGRTGRWQSDVAAEPRADASTSNRPSPDRPVGVRWAGFPPEMITITPRVRTLVPRCGGVATVESDVRRGRRRRRPQLLVGDPDDGRVRHFWPDARVQWSTYTLRSVHPEQFIGADYSLRVQEMRDAGLIQLPGQFSGSALQIETGKDVSIIGRARDPDLRRSCSCTLPLALPRRSDQAPPINDRASAGPTTRP